MTDVKRSFMPNWASPPGESIVDIIEGRGWTQAELAQRLGYTEKHVSQLINGKVPLSIDAAQRLERVLGSTVDFWLTRETNYQKHKARLEVEAEHKKNLLWLEELPLKYLMDSGTIPKKRIDENQKPHIVEACLSFFCVASPDEWRTRYCKPEASFRRSHVKQSNMGAIAAWLRLGEQEAEKLHPQKYDKTQFEKILPTLRALTREDPHTFAPLLRKLLLETGVSLVFVPAIPRAHVSGIARWLGPLRPLIQMSLYGKTNDKFWFTFFHEVAHILLHANNKEEKKAVFLDDPGGTENSKPQEQEVEANQWAREYLIPKKYSQSLNLLRSRESVKNFANEIGIHPGIVVGRLQHDKIIQESWMNDLKQSFSSIKS